MKMLLYLVGYLHRCTGYEWSHKHEVTQLLEHDLCRMFLEVPAFIELLTTFHVIDYWVDDLLH
jgi:hypothetical protein